MNRGDIYRVRLAPTRGHEQSGPRYAVVVQATELLELSTAIVAPTSTRAAPATFRPEIELFDQVTRVLVEQLRVVDVQRLGDLAGHLTAAEQHAVDDALTLVLDL
ncbi:MAG TPA: type II toxin-antitoxin system PemK/MazF family toxin [Solirubrobacteraceae bacterium]|nr:type II toxin-antitoxin system PemK/MazF family toxin [Solirubrobacteraceae bacterium]